MLLAAGATANPLRAPTDQLTVDPRGDFLELSWSDAEERLQGSISPAAPREGEPFKVAVQLGRFEGPPFEGPITFTLREEGATHGQTVTVPRGEHHWQATFTPENDGPHLLDVSFRTTRYKALHTPLQVMRSARVPRLLGWGALGLGALVLIGYSVRSLLRGGRPEEQAPASSIGEPAPSEAPPSVPLSENPVAASTAGPEAEAPSTPESPKATAAPLPEPEHPPAPASDSTPAEQTAPGGAPLPSPEPPENTPPAGQ